MQGGVVPLPAEVRYRHLRARFNPLDGQLYVAGLKGWQTNGAKDGAFQRVRYTGKPVTMPNEPERHRQGHHIGFTGRRSTQSTASDPGNYAIEQWNYRWTKDYGSAGIQGQRPERKGPRRRGRQEP